MTEINVMVPDWVLYVVTVYLFVAAGSHLVNAYYLKKKIELEYWKNN